MPSPRKKQDLLEFYRRRETEAEEDMKALRGRLDSIEATQRQMHELEWSVVQKDRELSETRKREGALQEILFGERDNALRLQARIDRLQLLREEDRRKIAFLLTLTTDSSSARQRHGETTYFVPTHKVPHAKTMKAAAAAASSSSSSLNESYSELPPEETIELLRHAVGALKRQLEEQRRITREHTQVLVEGKATLEEALEQRVEEQNAQMEKMVKEIERLRTALTDTTRDFLEERAAFRARERLRMEQSEEASGRVERAGEQVAETRRALHEQQEEAIAEAMRRCEGTVDGFRRRTVALEREVKRAQAEADAAQELKRRAGRLLKERMAQMQRRVEEERRRRRVEREGFDCDRTRLTQRISTLEQQLTESLERTTSHPNPTSAHSEPLSVLTQTAQRSRKVQSDLNRLKSHIYKVEGDLRKL